MNSPEFTPEVTQIEKQQLVDKLAELSPFLGPDPNEGMENQTHGICQTQDRLVVIGLGHLQDPTGDFFYGSVVVVPRIEVDQLTPVDTYHIAKERGVIDVKVDTSFTRAELGVDGKLRYREYPSRWSVLSQAIKQATSEMDRMALFQQGLAEERDRKEFAARFGQDESTYVRNSHVFLMLLLDSIEPEQIRHGFSTF
jgi:hypothetical protein